jgi:hypothetical protein
MRIYELEKGISMSSPVFRVVKRDKYLLQRDEKFFDPENPMDLPVITEHLTSPGGLSNLVYTGDVDRNKKQAELTVGLIGAMPEAVQGDAFRIRRGTLALIFNGQGRGVIGLSKNLSFEVQREIFQANVVEELANNDCAEPFLDEIVSAFPAPIRKEVLSDPVIAKALARQGLERKVASMLSTESPLPLQKPDF